MVRPHDRLMDSHHCGGLEPQSTTHCVVTLSSMSSRRGRPTIRCLQNDLELDLPPLDQLLDDIQHPWMDELRRTMADSPKGQKRILVIKSPHVFRLRVSDERGATWVDKSCEVVWLCAVQRREDGSEDDAFSYFEELHTREQLLPGSDDALRMKLETVLFQHKLNRDALFALVDYALAHPREEITMNLSNEIPCRVIVLEANGMQELWCGLSVKAENGQYIDTRRRDLLIAELERHLAPAEAEGRDDWATGEPVEWFEAVRLVIRLS